MREAFEVLQADDRYWEAPKGGYSAMWAGYDNTAGQAQVIGVPTPSGQERIQGPADLPRTEGSRTTCVLSSTCLSATQRHVPVGR